MPSLPPPPLPDYIVGNIASYIAGGFGTPTISSTTAPSSGSQTIGSPMGLLLALTYATTS